VAGIMIADYFIHRKRLLNVEALYQTDGEYSYRHGFSLVGLGSLLVAVAPNVPGFLAAVGVVEKASLPPLLATCYNYAWFTGFGLAFILYLILRKIAPGS
jgi:NCS1 family nucleobase:cation symporter-1